jgi:hypothetical protein
MTISIGSIATAVIGLVILYLFRKQILKLRRYILAVILGIVACFIAKFVVISISGSIISPPEGMNMNDMESIKANAHLFQPKHFIMPFMDHALGSLVGGLVAALVAASRKMTFAIVIGAIHLLGGIAAAFIVPAPIWFIVLDLVVAYIPMAYLGGLIFSKCK